jgi:hypothetical protein
MKKKILIFVVLLCLMQTGVFAGVQRMEFNLDDRIVEINEPVLLDLRVYDESGAVVEDYQTLKEIVVGASDGSFVYWSRDEETLKPKLTFLPFQEGDVYLYALTRDGVKAQAMVTVEEPGVPTYVEGVRGSLHWKTVEGAGFLLSHDRMTIVDQYGRAFDLENPYYVEVKDSDGQVLGQVDEDAEVFLPSPKAGKTESYKLVIHDPDGMVEDGTTALYLTGIEVTDIASYHLDPVGRLYGGASDSLLDGLGLDLGGSLGSIGGFDLSGLFGSVGASDTESDETIDENSDYAKDLILKGFMADGEEVALDRFITYATTSVGDLVGFSPEYDRIYGQSAGTATIGLWHQLTRCAYLDVTVSSEAPSPEDFVFEGDYDYVVRVGTTLDLSETLAIYDQYGVEITEDVAGQWFVDDPGLAMMNRESGILRGLDAGTLTFGFITETGKVATHALLIVE